MAVGKNRVLQAFGAVLRGARKERDITQETLAELARLSAVFVSNMENGKYQPSLTKLLALEAALELPSGDLVRRTQEALGTTTRRKRLRQQS